MLDPFLSLGTLKSMGFFGVLPNKIKILDLTSNYKKLLDKKFPIILDPAMLANSLGIKKHTLYWASSPYSQAGVRKIGVDPKGKPITEKYGRPLYKVSKLPKGKNKKTGKTMYRYIQAPERRLKYIQKKIVSKILNHVELPDYITGFRLGRGPTYTSSIHSKKHIVVSLDIKNFFNSIKQSHLVELFTQFFGYPKEVSVLLAELCTYKYFVPHFLPQGAPSSPALSNIVGYYFFDKKIKELMDKHGFEMTRFADDITISTNKEFPAKRELDEEGNLVSISSDLDGIISEISGILAKSGFQLNKYKTKIMRTGARKWVLGQVVNEHPNIIKESYDALRATVYNVSITSLEKQASRNNMTEHRFLSWLRGKIAHLTQVNRTKGEKLKEWLKLVLEAEGHLEDIKEIKIHK